MGEDGKIIYNSRFLWNNIEKMGTSMVNGGFNGTFPVKHGGLDGEVIKKWANMGDFPGYEMHLTWHIVVAGISHLCC